MDGPPGRTGAVVEQVVVTRPARRSHNRAQRRVANAIEAGLSPELDVVTEAGWRHGATSRVPDVAVFAVKPDVASPRGEVVVDDHGVVPLDLDVLLAPRRAPRVSSAGASRRRPRGS